MQDTQSGGTTKSGTDAGAGSRNFFVSLAHSRYLGILVFCVISVVSFFLFSNILKILDLSALDVSRYEAMSTHKRTGNAPPQNAHPVPSDLLHFFLQNESMRSGIAETASRVVDRLPPWPFPPAGMEVVAADVPGFQANIKPLESRVGTVRLRFSELPKFTYKDDGSTASLRLSVDTNRKDSDPYNWVEFSGLDASISNVDRENTILAFRLMIESGGGWFSSDYKLTQRVEVPREALLGGSEQHITLRVMPRIDPSIVVPKKLPEIITATLDFVPLNPDGRTGRDSDPARPDTLLPSAEKPFLDRRDNVSYYELDATDFIAVGGLNRFTILIVNADSELRSSLVATRVNNNQIIGRYSEDGRIFVAASDDWSPILLHFVATKPGVNVNYQIHATANDHYPAFAFLLYLASLESRIVKSNGVPESPTQTLDFLSFYSDAVALDFAATDMSEIDDPNILALIQALSQRAPGGSY